MGGRGQCSGRLLVQFDLLLSLLGLGGDILGGELIWEFCVVNSCCWGKGFVVTRAMVGTGWFSPKSDTREPLYLRKLHITVRTMIPPAMNLNNLDLETFFEVCLVVVHLLQHILALTDCTASSTHLWSSFSWIQRWLRQNLWSSLDCPVTLFLNVGYVKLLPTSTSLYTRPYLQDDSGITEM